MDCLKAGRCALRARQSRPVAEGECLNREEFVVVGWTDPEGARPFLGALLLGYYDPEGRLIYAGRAGTGIGHAELERLWRRLQPLATPAMPLDIPPPPDSRFGSPLPSRACWPAYWSMLGESGSRHHTPSRRADAIAITSPLH